MLTKNKNVWIILALSLFLSPTLALAQYSVEDATSTTSCAKAKVGDKNKLSAKIIQTFLFFVNINILVKK